jgi:hypothetical protein
VSGEASIEPSEQWRSRLGLNPFAEADKPGDGFVQHSTANYNVVDGVLTSSLNANGDVILPDKITQRFELQPNQEVLIVDVGFGVLIVSSRDRREVIENMFPDFDFK